MGRYASLVAVAILLLAALCAADECPGNNAASVHAPVNKSRPCDEPGVASLALELGDAANLTCALNTYWAVDKAASAAALDGPRCDSANRVALNYTVTVEALEDALTYGLGGHIDLTITNGGSADAPVVSIVLLLEKLGAPANASQQSYGPGGQNHRLIAAVGAERPSALACADATPGQEPDAAICYSECVYAVPYAGAQLFDLDAQAALDLAALLVPAGESAELHLAFEFLLAPDLMAEVLQDLQGYRISVLVTFDSNCARGAACDFDYDCSGAANTIRTVQVRTCAFAWPGECTERCGCVTVRDELLAAPGGGDCLAYGAASSLAPDAVVCEDAAFSQNLTGMCCNCTAEYVLNNTVTLAPAEEGSCADWFGRPLVEHTTASVSTHVTCPAPPPPPPSPPAVPSPRVVLFPVPPPPAVVPSPPATKTPAGVPSSAAPPPGPPAPCTFTQGGYGACDDGNLARLQCVRVATPQLYAGGGLSIGLPLQINGNVVLSLPGASPRFSATFTSPQGVIDYLPAMGTPAYLKKNHAMPTDARTASGVFGGQVLTALLNFAFTLQANASLNIVFNRSLSSCSSTAFAGLPAGPIAFADILAVANILLSGNTQAGVCASPELPPSGQALCSVAVPAGLGIASAFNAVVDAYNNAYDNCAFGAASSCFRIV